ncbi:MAG: hypothetical protein KJ072_21010 [Verrucomicrobia bacterium]|nr:hypothetical protein [Verrucomicrobiota bacterium]
MRALLAGLFVFTATLAMVGFIGSHYPDHGWPWWAVPSIIVVMLGSIVAAFLVFNRVGFRQVISGKSAEEQIAELEQKGLLASESFSARRAFQVEEFEDEGSHYFMELEDGRVLYLNGQYLYDYAEISDDPELKQPRSFPCSRFTVRRHKSEGYVVDIVCEGGVLNPECVAPSFDEQDAKHGLIPEDGQVYRDRSYDQLKRERLKGRSTVRQ